MVLNFKLNIENSQIGPPMKSIHRGLFFKNQGIDLDWVLSY